MQKELNTRHKTAKKVLMEQLEDQENKEFKSDKFYSYIKEIKSQRLDVDWAKKFLKEQGYEPVFKESTSKQLKIEKIE